MIRGGDYRLIDIDFCGLTLAGFNIYYSLNAFILPNFEEKTKWFLRGFVQAIDSKKELTRQLHYFLIADFSNELARMSNKYYDRIVLDLDYVKSRLFNVDNILLEEIYEKVPVS